MISLSKRFFNLHRSNFHLKKSESRNILPLVMIISGPAGRVVINEMLIPIMHDKAPRIRLV